MSDESINSITASNVSITPGFSYYGNKVRVKFNGSWLKQDKITYTVFPLITAGPQISTTL